MIGTNNLKKVSSMNSTRVFGQPLSTVKEMSETSTDHHQNGVEMKLLCQPPCLPAGEYNTESNDDFQTRSILEVDDKIMLHLVSSSILESSSTLETHL